MGTRLHRALVIALALTATGLAQADDGPFARIRSVIQENQDVIVTVSVPDVGGWMETPYRISRDTETRSYFIEDFQLFTPGEAARSIETCKNSSEHYCEQHPGKCEDCNGDGNANCYSPCFTVHTFNLVDECVPNGVFDYVLWRKLEEESEQDSVEIAVMDTGDPCNDQSDSCSVAAVGRRTTSLFLASLMLLIGLLALTTSRSDADH